TKKLERWYAVFRVFPDEVLLDSLQLLGSTLIGRSIDPEPLRFLPSPDLEPLLVITYPEILFHTFVKNLLDFVNDLGLRLLRCSRSLDPKLVCFLPCLGIELLPFAIQHLGIPIESGVDELEPEIVGNPVVVAVLLLEIKPDVLG
uniref:Uncharacterized protein n=1 Tax=Oryza meridionalis TaxID=40149 RepID=A0A0E0EUM0_9ORYZ